MQKLSDLSLNNPEQMLRIFFIFQNKYLYKINNFLRIIKLITEYIMIKLIVIKKKINVLGKLKLF